MSFLKSTLKHIALSVLSVLGGVALGATLVGAATTISTNVSTGGTLGVTGLSTLTAGFVSQASSTVVGAFTTTGAAALGSTLDVTGATTLASTTATALKVGQTGTRHTGLVSGYCTIADISVVTASSTVQVSCAGATGVVAGDLVFVQATSSMPMHLVINSATSTTGAINIRILNPPGSAGTPAAGVVSLNFWAVR